MAGAVLAASLAIRALPEPQPVDRLDRLRDTLLEISPAPFLALGMLAFAGLGALAVPIIRRRARKVLQGSLREDLEKLAAEKASGRWADLEPTPEMRQVDATLADTLRTLQKVERLAMPGAARASQVEKLEQRSVELIDQREKLDLKRRLTARVDLEQVFPPARNLGEKIVPPWMRRASHLLVLLIVAVGIGGALIRPLGRALDRRLTALDEARIAAAETHALSKLGDHPGTEEEYRALSLRSSRAFEVAFGTYLDGGPGSQGNERVAYRERLLLAYAAPEPDRVGLVAAMEAKGAADPATDASVAWLKERAELTEPVTSLGTRFRNDGAALAKKYPGILAQISASVGTAPIVAPGVTSLGALITSETFGAAIGELPQTSLPFVRDAAQALSSGISKDTLERIYRLKSRQFNTVLADSGSLTAASNTVARAPLDVLDESESASFQAALAKRPRLQGFLPVDSAPPALRAIASRDRDSLRAAAVLELLRDRLGFGGDAPNAWRITGTLAEYDDWSPAQKGSDLLSARNKLLAGWGAVLDQKSIFSLRGRRNDSARSAGVVIGLDPLTGKALPDLVAIDWTREADTIALTVTERGGRTVALGRFSAPIVRAALGYAADGRHLALGVQSTEPSFGRRAILHPALENTALGCRLAALAERIDVLARTPEVDPEADRALDEIAAYTVAWAVRVRQLDEISGFDGSAKHPPWARSEAEIRLLDPTLSARTDRALGDPARLKKSERSIVHARPAHFDPLLLEAIEECSGSTNRPRFEECLMQASRRWLGEGAQSLPWPWWNLPPDAEIALAITEAPYQLDADLTALRSPAEDAPDALVALLRFGATVTLMSPANKTGGEMGAFGRATSPIPSFETKLAGAVRRSIDENPDRRRALVDLGELVVLQRLFRLAIKGALGADFPVERLEALLAATPIMRVTRTPRWLDTAGNVEREFASTLRAAITAIAVPGKSPPPWLSQAGERFATCADGIDARAGAEQFIPEPLWSDRCIFPAPPSGNAAPWAQPEAIVRAVVRDAEALREARRLRLALRVGDDDRRISDPAACGPL